ncbi:hypothetical protein OGZ37_11370 [Lactococcus lactis]|uniref:hypothetical protein n=1 Tax=Lactococcus lactis TaxID=1358 RepID=UPI002418754E|nr:hypothetical protein [Lactococcus lactis]MDG4967161.1 hypothetical protein [Lactococcus lactis]
MKNKKLAVTNGITGIVGGALLIVLTIIFWSLAFQASYSSTNDNSYDAGYQLGSQYSGFVLGSLLIDFIIIVGLFILGIVALNYYKTVDTSKAPHILLIVGSCLSVIPLVGKIIGGILLIVGGVNYLINIKKIDRKETFL